MVFINRSTSSNSPNSIYYDNFAPSGGGYTSPNNILSTGKHVIVVSLTSSTINIYQDGSHINSGNNSKTSGDNYNGDTPIKILIGGSIYSNSTINFGDDKLYSVAVWNRTLSQSEAQSITFDMMANKSSLNTRTLFNKLEFTNNMTITNNNFSINETFNDNITTLNKSSLDIQKLYPQSSINFKDRSGNSDLFIDHIGNIGIGTDNPTTNLHVKSTGNEGKILIENEELALLQLVQSDSNKTYNVELGRKVSKPLAGADGTESFTPYASATGASGQNVSYIYDNSLSTRYVFNSPRNGVFTAVDFATPQVVNKYRLWGYILGNIEPWPTNWEFRASKVNRASYVQNDPSTYDVLDTKNISGVPTFTNSDGDASANLNSSYEASISNTTAYTYYVLHIINNGGDITNTTLYQFAVYGDKPSEVTLAGAGIGNVIGGFTTYGLWGNYATNVISESSFNGQGQHYSVDTMSNKIYSNYFGGDEMFIRNNNIYPLGVAYDFTIPKVVNKYRLWSRGTATRAIKSWELRGASKYNYNSQDSGTYDILDTQTNYVLKNTDTTGRTASTNVNYADTFTFTNTTAYTYYILHITANGGDTGYTSVSEWALYNENTSDLTFRSTTDEKMRITENGNVGIGIDNPSQKLEVNGNLKVNGNVESNNNGIVQVKSTSFTGTESGNGNWEHIEELDVTITPSSSSNKIFLKLDLHWSGANDAYFQGLVYRSIAGGSDTIVVQQGVVGNATRCSFANRNQSLSGSNWTYQLQNLGFSHLDTPNTTSAITYKIKVRNRYTGHGLWYINRTYSTNDQNRLTGVSTFTAFEVVP